MASSRLTLALGEKICIGDFEFTATADGGLKADPVFTPHQAFHFGSLDFVASNGGILWLTNGESTTEPPMGKTIDNSGINAVNDALRASFARVFDYASPSLHGVL